MTETTNIDRFDIQILRALRDDGRLTVQALAEQIGLSATPTARRLKRLEEGGILKGYSALIDETALGFAVTVFVSVQLDRQVDDALARFEAAVEGFEEVVDCWLMTGNRDYLLRIVTRDLREFEQFLVGQLTKVRGCGQYRKLYSFASGEGGVGKNPLSLLSNMLRSILCTQHTLFGRSPNGRTQGLFQIVQNILHLFQPDRQANKTIGNQMFCSFLRAVG